MSERVSPPSSSTTHAAPPSGEWVFADAPTRSVEVFGAMIRYRLWEKAGREAPALLFLHGFRAHARWWDHIIPYFEDDCRIVAMDFSGLGDSDWRQLYASETFAREILAVVADAALAPVTIVAHSFAGTPAGYAAVLAPETIRHVILVDSRLMLSGIPDPEAGEVRAVLADRQFSPERRFYPTRASLLPRFRLLPPSDAVPAEVLEYVARHSARREPDGWTWKFDPKLDPQLRGDPNRTIPPGLVTPFKYVYGDSSAVVTPALANMIAARLPACGAPIVIPSCNHHVLLEQPFALVAALRLLLAHTGTIK